MGEAVEGVYLQGGDGEADALAEAVDDPRPPFAELPAVPRNALDRPAGRTAARVVVVVVGVSRAAVQLEPLPLEEGDHPRPVGQEGAPPGGRRGLVRFADHGLQVVKPVLVGILDAVRPHQRVVRYPEHAARHAGGAADDALLFHDHRLQAGRVGRKRGRQPAAAAAHDHDVEGLILHEMSTSVADLRAGRSHLERVSAASAAACPLSGALVGIATRLPGHGPRSSRARP